MIRINKSSELYDMKLHDQRTLYHPGIDGISWSITRVPGGWIYSSPNTNNSVSVFVPFDNEFMKEKMKYNREQN